MEAEYFQAEFHLFQRFGKNILFNVETMLFYEVTPLVCDLVPHLGGNGHQDPVKILKKKYRKQEIKDAPRLYGSRGFHK